MVVTVGFSPEPPSPNTTESGGGYSTFEVKIPAIKKQETNSYKRFALVGITVAVLCLTALSAPHSSPKSVSGGLNKLAVVEAIKLSIEGASPEKEERRTKFLESLEEHYPESMKESMNFSIDPCSNFYEYSCGQWIADAKIAADQGSASKSWDAAENNSYTVLRSLMEAEYPIDSEYVKVHDWYESCMDTDRLNELKAKPLKPYLKHIDSIQDEEGLWNAMAFTQLWSIPTMISLAVNADEKDPHEHDLFLDNGGLILPDASYYDTSGDFDEATTATNKRNMELLNTYIKTITQLAGYSEEDAELTANRTIEVEQMLAEFESDEPYVDSDEYLHYSLADLEKHAPGIPWSAYFTRLREGCEAEEVKCLEGVGGGRSRVVMDAPYFYTKLSEAFTNRSADYWVPYLRAHVIYNLSPLLSSDFLNATFRIDSELEGVEDPPPRWKKCVSAVKHALPGVVDRLYVETVFPGKAREDAEVMLEQLRDAFVQNLASVDWMDPKTRSKAVAKAKAIQFNIGAPREWPALLDSYRVSRESYFDNSMQAYHRKVLFMLAKLSQPVDRHEWTMKASTVNAYYDNGVTGLFVPAAMLQPPFFSAAYPPERNFGGIGTVMGHEFTHGFDDTGRKYDAKSRLREWWAKPAVTLFQKNSQCLASLYGGFSEAGESLDGNNTLGENIADEGGVKIALRAFENLHRLEHHGHEATDHERRVFFTSFAQNWCDKERLKTMKMSVQTDEHSPSVFRVNGVVSQNPDFARVFHCPAGAPMDPVHRCVLWSDSRPAGEELAGAPRSAARRRRLAAAAARRRWARGGGGARSDFDLLAPGTMLPDIRHR